MSADVGVRPPGPTASSGAVRRPVAAEGTKARLPGSDRDGPGPTAGAYFEIYRADRVTLTSILFSGEDWRWRFCSIGGSALASGGGFSTASDCLAAVDALRAGAGAAPLRERT